ncbi:hypothetical protein MANY_34590 [Mycolicibacterium anyangense]|uniref:DUF7847 domain-containing protein n=1 Tax=Mycolicibacterium anyangense TaxID=1431246 RepID=A0A6N4WDS8_9MYCO|nr:hypothetical protein [Mycolicibacterium anyangense]BBZ78122.1 hypothetical protein MANY_34590 [Mycolicibacterium anyangense]
MTTPPPGPGWPPYGWPGQPQFPPPSYPQAGPYVAPPRYPPSGYPPPGYPPPGYPPPSYPPPGFLPPVGLKPGIIPLRPLSLSDIFNGAVGYIRTNPKATLGLTAVVVIITQILALLLQLGPLAYAGRVGAQTGDELSTPMLIGSAASTIAGGIATALSAILLSGMLTVVVGRAVFGSTITVGEAWQRVRGRLLALIGLSALEVVAAVVVIGAVILAILGISVAGNTVAAVLVGIPLVLMMIAVLLYLYTALAFAPVAIVLERKSVMEAINRSFGLVRNHFWRVLGIRLLASLVAGLVAGAVAVPFSIAGQLTALGADTSGPFIAATAIAAVGGAIGQIVTAPFNAGVVVLLYTDIRIRAEAFDLVLQTGAARGPAEADAGDALWLTAAR